MKQFKTNRIIQIVYPIILYYVLYNMLNVVFVMLLGEKGGFSKLFCLLLAALCTLPVIYKVYISLPIVKAVKQFEKEQVLKELLYILGIVVIGIGLNILFTKLGLTEMSSGYTNANSTLYSGTVITKILANAIVIPMLEEVLYRGIICGQLDLWYGKVPAVIISAFCFGIMHFNVIQFLYAFLVGLALAMVYVRTKKLWVTIAAHGITNLVVIIYAILVA